MSSNNNKIAGIIPAYQGSALGPERSSAMLADTLPIESLMFSHGCLSNYFSEVNSL